jgi:hypothetical protein
MIALAGSTRTAWATPSMVASEAMRLAQAVNAPSAADTTGEIDWQTYTGTAFSIQYPQGGSVSSATEDTIEIVSPRVAPTVSIHTQVQLLRENPEVVIERGIDGLISEQVRVGRYNLVTVNGHSGIRLWVSDRAGERANAVVTYIGYGDAQTVVLTSEYSSDDPEAESIVVQMHDSFVNQGL